MSETANQRLGRSSVMVSRLGVGTMTWGAARGLGRLHPAKTAYGGAESAEEERGAFEVSLNAGVTLFDTAAMYAGGASERRLGELARGTAAVVATKFPPSLRATAEDMPRALRESLTRLNREHVDLYQHHFPAKRVDIPRLMSLMADAVDAGKARAVGVSNYSPNQMRLAHAELAKRDIPLASNQVEYSLLHRQPETNGLLDAARDLGITVIAYQPMAGGALTGKYLGQRARGLRRFMMPYFRGDAPSLVAPIVGLLRDIGGRHNKTPGQVALRWLMEQHNVIPIPGAKNANQAAANAEALTFALEHDEVEALGFATTAWRT